MKQSQLLKKIDNKNFTSMKKKYNFIELLLYEIGEKKKYLVIFIKLNNQDILMNDNSKEFDKLISSISMYSEQYLKSEFLRWNVYIFYLIK